MFHSNALSSQFHHITRHVTCLLATVPPLCTIPTAIYMLKVLCVYTLVANAYGYTRQTCRVKRATGIGHKKQQAASAEHTHTPSIWLEKRKEESRKRQRHNTPIRNGWSNFESNTQHTRHRTSRATEQERACGPPKEEKPILIHFHIASVVWVSCIGFIRSRFCMYVCVRATVVVRALSLSFSLCARRCMYVLVVYFFVLEMCVYQQSTVAFIIRYAFELNC